MTQVAQRPGRGLLRTVLINAGIFLLLLAILEAAVRVRALVKYGFAGGVEDILTVDQGLQLRVPVPGRTLGPITINSLGFRGPEISVDKPRGTIRLAFLGASTTFCAEVSGNDAVWPHLVWQRLRQEFPGYAFDYVNGGVPGYGVASSLKNLVSRVGRLHPDVIVIYHATNDLSGNSYELAKKQGLIAERPDRQQSWLSHYSLLVRLVELNMNISRNQMTAEKPTGKLVIDLPQLVAPFRADLARLLAEAGSRAPVVAIATFSTQFRPDQPLPRLKAAAGSSLYYMPYMSIQELLDGFAAYNDVIRDLARSDGAVLIESANAIPGDTVHFRDSVHFTDAGSAAMAQVVGDALIASPQLQALVRRTERPAPPGR